MLDEQFVQSLGGIRSPNPLSAGSALIPRSQIIDVLKGLNVREGLFSEEEIKELENGYSVSESDDDLNSQMSGASSHLDGLNSQRSPDFEYRMTGGAFQRISQANVPEDRLRLEQHRSILNAEIGSMKSKYLKKLTNLERQIDNLHSEKRELQHIIENQKQTFKMQLIQQEQKTKEQLTEIKENQIRLQGQVPNFKEKLDMYKKEFTNGTLLISEETYVELKAKSEENRSLKEFIQVKVYESLDRYQQEMEILRRENDQMAEDIMKFKVKSDKLEREYETLKKLSREREEDHRRRIEALERRNKELEHDCHKLGNQQQILIDKGSMQRETENELRELDIEHRNLKNQYKLLEDQYHKLQEIKLESERRQDSLRREVEILNQDKTYLIREKTSLEEKYKRCEDKLDRVESELLDSKRTCQKYMDRVLATNDDVKQKFEQQYTQEINDLKDRHARELDLAKQNLTEIYEKRVQYLQERLTDVERRLMKTEQDYRDKQMSFEELMVEYRQLQKSGDEEIGRLKLALMSKNDEVQRISNLYEDNMLLVKESKLENEALKQKIEVLKQEYYKLESTNRQSNCDIKAELAVCKERLANYELIEKELDQAIMNVANNENIDGGIDCIGNALIQTITSAPTTAKRRIQQSLLLANRLQGKQKENEELLKEIKMLKEKLESAESEVKFHKRMMDKANQPHSYLMQDIERTENELMATQKKCKLMDQEIKNLRKEKEQLQLQKKGLSDDLQKLLVKRQEIDNLQTTLLGIIQHSSQKKIDIEELKFKLADSLRQSKFKNESTASKENFQRKNNQSKSKSPGKFMNNNYQSLDEVPERGSAVKTSGVEVAPAWYKALKNNIAK